MGLPEGWQKAQAAKCGCRGTDDFCACVNAYDPAKYGLAVTEKCEDCGLLASSLLHRLCERPNCAVREHLALSASTASPESGQHTLKTNPMTPWQPIGSERDEISSRAMSGSTALVPGPKSESDGGH